MTNKEQARDREFMRLCEGANVPATARQASKYRQRRGRAYVFAQSKGLRFTWQGEEKRWQAAKAGSVR